MQVTKVKINSIKTNPKNPRLIKDDKFKKLVNSIKEFPQMLELRPIVVDENNIILGGNMRHKACIEAGLKEVYIVQAKDLTEQQKDEFIVKDNVGFGEWDWDILANEWDTDKLTDWGLDLPLDVSVQELEAEEDNYDIPDEINTDIVIGDLFEIGEHRLLCGDSTDSDQVAKLMNGKKADLVFTDPPYGMAYESNAWDSKKSEVKQKRTDTQILNDENTNVGQDALNLIPLFLENNRHFYIWCRWDCFNDFKEVCENIGKINEFGFKNGVQGLAEMSRQSKEFRINMSEAFKLADKVMDPANAIDMVANLQVIGGAFGDLNDPLKLMYDATNNVEALQDSLIKAASGLATYNQEQGRFEILGINQRRVRDMAAAMGVDYRELTKSAIASQERMLANNDLMAKGFSIPEKDKEFITNLAKMDNGKMVIEIPKSLSEEFEGKSKIALEDLSQKQYETLEANRKAFEDMSPEDIARDQVTSVLNIERDLAAMLELNKIDLSRKINSKEAIKIASDYEKKIGLYTKEYIKGDKGLLSEEFKGNANAMFEKVKNSPLVLGEINKYKSFLDALGDKNPKIKKMFEDVDSKMKEDIKNSTNSATSTTVDYNHKHTFEYKATPGYMESLNRENVRNPGQFNEWAERNSKEFTTPNTAVKN